MNNINDKSVIDKIDENCMESNQSSPVMQKEPKSIKIGTKTRFQVPYNVNDDKDALFTFQNTNQ
mgnify:CR=1 FL=1